MQPTKPVLKHKLLTRYPNYYTIYVSINNLTHSTVLTLFRMDFFGAADGYPTMMKLGFFPYPKNIQKIYEPCGTPLEFC